MQSDLTIHTFLARMRMKRRLVHSKFLAKKLLACGTRYANFKALAKRTHGEIERKKELEFQQLLIFAKKSEK